MYPGIPFEEAGGYRHGVRPRRQRGDDQDPRGPDLRPRRACATEHRRVVLAYETGLGTPETPETHRRDVRDAILETTTSLVAEHGLRAATMSRIAEETGIGRATLYKYFPDVNAILITWHQQHVTNHLEHLTAVRDQAAGPGARLDAVLAAYAQIVHGMSRHGLGAEFVALVHRDDRVAEPRRQLHDLVRDVLVEAVDAGRARDDVEADELATYCLHALAAAGELASPAAVDRLVGLTLAGLRPAT